MIIRFKPNISKEIKLDIKIPTRQFTSSNIVKINKCKEFEGIECWLFRTKKILYFILNLEPIVMMYEVFDDLSQEDINADVDNEFYDEFIVNECDLKESYHYYD